MLRRLIVGLVIGLLIGGLLAVGLIKGGFVTLGAVLAYVSAAMTGVLVGLIAGKPIWAAGGQIEAGVKAIFGALFAAGAMFALRQWVHVEVPAIDTSFLSEPSGAVGDLPLVALPLIGAILGAFYEADNTPEDKSKQKGPAGPSKAALPPGARAANGKARVAAPPPAEVEDDEAESSSKRARR